jgi:ubiquinone/menaquinone biosynthesis C-methylase UbiE
MAPTSSCVMPTEYGSGSRLPFSAMSATPQEHVDERNAQFWDELCGTALARSIGITDHSDESLRRFDEAYMARYPYLPAQLRPPRRPGEPLLEIGLGYGTVSRRLAQAGFDYHGLDIAAGPVGMVRHRLGMLGIADAQDRVVVGSALEVPHPDGAFSHVVTIGCLHHTGDLPKAVSEVYRVLEPGGTAMVMLYNRYSFRQLVLRAKTFADRTMGRHEAADERLRAAYDSNAEGHAAPETVFVTARQVRDELFAPFSSVRVEHHNFDPTRLFVIGDRGIVFKREWALPTVARLVGLDLYVHARK